VDIFSYNYDGEVAPDARSAGFRSWALPGLTELDEQVNPIAPSSGAAPACDGDNEPDDTADPPNQIPGIAAASDDVGSRNAPRHSAFPAGPSKATPVVAPFDEAAIADALASKGFTLEAAFVRRFKGHTTVHWMDIVEGVCPGEDRDWATVKTWVHRVKSALLEIDSHCRLSFSTTTRDHLVIKKVLSK